jgi:hypothetical protein
MKIIVQSEKDVLALHGKWVVQINTETPDVRITEQNWDFYAEKRISFIRGLKFIGLWYDHGNYKTWEDFAFKFNHYVEGDAKGTRFHRLLTNREIDLLCKKFKEGL